MLVRIMEIKKKMRRVWTKKGKVKFPECVNRFIEDHGYGLYSHTYSVLWRRQGETPFSPPALTPSGSEQKSLKFVTYFSWYSCHTQGKKKSKIMIGRV